MKYADPRRCPDCRGPIEPGIPTCPSCGLVLTGSTAQRLFATLATADQLLASLRAMTNQSLATPAPPTPTAAAFDPAPLPHATAPARPRGLSATSVPRILLGLGAVCLLVAALVFLAVTWSVLGVGGRTVTLLALTAVAGGISGWLQRRRLRAAAEALALVGYGMLTLDVVGADHAGWWGDLSTAGFLTLLGVVLAAAGATGALVVRRSHATSLVSGEVVAAIGSALVAFAWGTATWLPVAPSLVVATLVAGALSLAAYRAGLTVAALGSGVVTGFSWVALMAVGLDRALGAPTWDALLTGARFWPLCVAGAMVAAIAVPRRIPTYARVAAVGLAELLVVIALLAPARLLDPTPVTLLALGLLAATGALTVVLPGPWRLTGLGTQVLAGLGTLGSAAAVALTSVSRLGHAAAEPWTGSAGDVLRGEVPTQLPAPWLLPVALLALLGTAWALLRALPFAVTVEKVDARTTGEAFTAVLAVGAIAAVAAYPVPIWLVLALLLLVSGTSLARWVAVRSEVALGSGVVFATGALALGLHATSLTEVTLVVVLLMALLVQVTGARWVATGAGATAVATLAALTWTTGALLDVDGRWVALAGLVLLGATTLLSPYVPQRWWHDDARTGGEVASAVAAVPLVLAGLDAVPAGSYAGWLALYLTVAGVVVTVLSLLRADRRALSWAGGLLLALASWVRLWDLGVHAPEAYTLPSAVVLLAVGLLHLRRNPHSPTMTALAPGLALGLVPSLLWALVEEPGLRALLLGAACLALVVVGVRLGWTAPLLLGAAVGGLLVLRLAAPYVGTAVPRWVLIGMAGALLVAMGATWERRLQEARHLAGYVRGLR